MKITPIIIAISCLSHFSSYGQEIDSLILGTWRWNNHRDSIVILKRVNKFKRKPASLLVNKTDTMYRSIYAPFCGNSRGKYKYVFRRGPWYFDSNGLFVIKYEHREFYVKEWFEVIDFNNSRITLRKVKQLETEISQ